jgi:TP901 family phage tail tape measure protein
MSFSVSYNYKIIDKYSPKLKEIASMTRQFNGIVNGLSDDVNKTSSQLSKMASKATGAAKRLNNINKGSTGFMAGVGGALSSAKNKLDGFASSAGSLAGTIGGALALNKMKTSAFELEKSVVNLNKQFTFANDQALVDFQNKMAGVGSVIGQSKTEMNSLAFEAGKLGIPVEDVDKFAMLAGKVAVAFEDNLGNATGVLADMRTKLGLNNSQLESTLDVVNTLADNTSASGKDILQVVQRLSGTFKSLGVPPEVAASFSAIARQLQVTPELAASGMKMFIQGLQDTKKFAPEIGAALTTDFEGTIAKVIDKIRQIPVAARGATVQELFGKEATSFVLNLAKSTDVYTNTLKLAKDQTKVAGSMQREFERATTTAAFAQQQLKADIDNAWADIGTLLLPVMKELMTAARAVVTRVAEFAKANPGITKAAVGFLAVATALAPVAMVLSSVISIFSFLFTVGSKVFALFKMFSVVLPIITSIGSAIGAFFITPLGVVIGVIGGFVAGIAAITIAIDQLFFGGKNTAEMLDWLIDKFTTIKNLASDFASGALNSILSFVGFGEAPSIDNTLASNKGIGGESLTVNKQSKVNANLQGSVVVSAVGGASVKSADFSSNLPGNLGSNIAGRK